MHTYTEEQAKKDAVTVWKAIYETILNKKMTLEFARSLEIGGFHVIKELALRNNYPEFMKLQNSCSYCERVLSPTGRLDCSSCIGYRNDAFGKHMTCNNVNSTYSKMVSFASDNCDIREYELEDFKKQLLEYIKYHLDTFTEILERTKS